MIYYGWILFGIQSNTPYVLGVVIASSGLYSSSPSPSALSFMLARIFERLGGIDMLASTFDEVADPCKSFKVKCDVQAGRFIIWNLLWALL